jgi:putative transposase
MKRKRFSEEQIIGILNEAAAGATAVEVCRRHGVSETTFYRWKAKFGGIAVSDARRLRQLEAENSRLKAAFWRRRIWTMRRSRICWEKCMVRPASQG